jgi:hypothetical protein
LNLISVTVSTGAALYPEFHEIRRRDRSMWTGTSELFNDSDCRTYVQHANASLEASYYAIRLLQWNVVHNLYQKTLSSPFIASYQFRIHAECSLCFKMQCCKLWVPDIPGVPPSIENSLSWYKMDVMRIITLSRIFTPPTHEYYVLRVCLFGCHSFQNEWNSVRKSS